MKYRHEVVFNLFIVVVYVTTHILYIIHSWNTWSYLRSRFSLHTYIYALFLVYSLSLMEYREVNVLSFHIIKYTYVITDLISLSNLKFRYRQTLIKRFHRCLLLRLLPLTCLSANTSQNNCHILYEYHNSNSSSTRISVGFANILILISGNSVYLRDSFSFFIAFLSKHNKNVLQLSIPR